MPKISALAIALTLRAAVAHSQATAVIDEATLTVTSHGSPAGRESFRIVRAPAPGGEIFRATGESALGERRLTTRLGTDSSGVPVSYECNVAERGEVVQHLQGRGRPGRFSILVQTKTGEAAREYVLNGGALLVEDDIFHHLFFVPLAAGHRQLIVISPRSGEQGRYQVEDRGNEPVEIAGHTVTSRHFALVGSRGVSRDVWVDAKDRLLKVAIAEKGLIALRDDPPRP